MSGSDKMHLIHDEWGRARNIDICSETEPTTTWPYMLWLKVSTATLKVRNLTNSAWVTVGTGGGGGAPTDAQYLVLALDADLTDERRLVAGDGLDLADGGAGGNATLTVDVDDLDGDGLQESGGDLAVDATVVRTSGAQEIAGEKTLTDETLIKVESEAALKVQDGDGDQALAVDAINKRIVVTGIHGFGSIAATHIDMTADLDLYSQGIISFKMGPVPIIAMEVPDTVTIKFLNDLLRFCSTGIKGQASSYPDLGSTTAAEMWGNIYQAAAKDVYPMADGGGLFQRSPNHWQTPTDHFNTFAGWTWAAYAPLDGAPSTIDTTTYPSILQLINDNVTEDHFCYVAFDGTGSVYARLAKGAYSYVGIRLQDGDNDNNDFVELKLIDGTTAGTVAIQRSYQNGGGGITNTTLLDNLPSMFYTLRIFKNAAGNHSVYYGVDTPLLYYFSGVAAAWTGARCGLVFGQRTVTTNVGAGFIDWFRAD